ncbi:MAG TPA: Rid family detoxifying hydrolase [Solirubrobacterales bacterium]
MSVSLQRDLIDAPEAPAAIGPYSHAVRSGGLLFCSGMIPLDPATGELVKDSVGAETERCLKNLEAVCEAGGTKLERTLKATIYTTDLDRFAEINEAYGSFFEGSPPARAAIGVASLPKGVKVEIEAIVAAP